MSMRRPVPRAILGFSMIEVMITIVILVVGLLGLAGLQARAMNAEAESLSRVRALMLVQDMIGRINVNLAAAKATPEIYADGSRIGAGMNEVTCPGAAGAESDLCAWDTALKGAALGYAGASTAGVMPGARGCITWDAVQQEFQVAVAWQGRGGSSGAIGTCGQDTIPGAERREVTGIIRPAELG